MNVKYQFRYVASLLKRYGFRGLVFKTLERSESPMRSYGEVYRRYLPTEEELARQRKTPMAFEPLVSVVVPAYETPERYLRELIGTLLSQTYANWELVLADGSAGDAVGRIAREYAAEDSRIRYLKLEGNGGISENTNQGFAAVRGEFAALMDHDDLLAENALYEMVKCLNDCFTEEERAFALVYSDEDKINGDGSVHSRPHFKPDYNPEFLRRNNYFCHLLMVSAELLVRTGGLNREYDGAQDYDFVLRCVEAGAKVRHVPRILYHWRIHEGSTAGNSADKAYAFDNGCRVIEHHLERMGETGKVSVTPNLGVYRIDYALRGDYTVTVAAKRQETLELLRDYYEKHPPEGFHLNLHYLRADRIDSGTVSECTGEYILFIADDFAVKPEGLIESLLKFCQHPGVGMAGAKLFTKRKRVSSCGMTYTAGGELIGLCGGLFAEYKGYFLHAVIPKNVSILPFGCVLIKRRAFEDVGGCSENFTGLYCDADFCFRLQEAGYQVIVTPEAAAVRTGREPDKAKEKEQRERFVRQWRERLLQPDPYYNPNLSQRAYHTYAMRE